MKIGVINNISGNIAALRNVDEQFGLHNVHKRICLGRIVGLYPYINECIEFIINRRYIALRHLDDDAFIDYCDGSHNFEGWSMQHMVQALTFSRQFVSTNALQYLRELPERHEMDRMSFESRLDLYPDALLTPEQVYAAFRFWNAETVFHTATLEPYVWQENSSGMPLSPGHNQMDISRRLLISTGGIGSRYASSVSPTAVIFDEDSRAIDMLTPNCDLEKILMSLRGIEYPQTVLRYLEENEYKTWR